MIFEANIDISKAYFNLQKRPFFFLNALTSLLHDYFTVTLMTSALRLHFLEILFLFIKL